MFAKLLIGFFAVVSLLRRQFTTFSPAERCQIWQLDRADAVLPLVGRLLGLSVRGD